MEHPFDCFPSVTPVFKLHLPLDMYHLSTNFHGIHTTIILKNEANHIIVRVNLNIRDFIVTI